MTGTRYQNCMARMFVSESDTIQYSRKAKRRPEVMQWFSRYFCGNYWLEKGEAADWLFACILRKIDVWTATWSQCWSMLDSLNKCYGQWVRILASMAGRNFLDTGPQHPPHVTTAAPKEGTVKDRFLVLERAALLARKIRKWFKMHYQRLPASLQTMKESPDKQNKNNRSRKSQVRTRNDDVSKLICQNCVESREHHARKQRSKTVLPALGTRGGF